jgi:hypothetical protein
MPAVCLVRGQFDLQMQMERFNGQNRDLFGPMMGGTLDGLKASAIVDQMRRATYRC